MTLVWMLVNAVAALKLTPTDTPITAEAAKLTCVLNATKGVMDSAMNARNGSGN